MKEHYDFISKISAPLRLCAFALIFFFNLQAQTLAPNAPGNDAQWSTAGKQGIGTSASLESKVWFTLAEGVMTEVYYPDVTVANVHLLQFVVVNPKTRKVETEQDDAVHQIKVLRPDSLTFQQINTAKSGEWTITKTYAAHPNGNAVWIDVQFQSKSKDLQLYAFYDPSLKNSGLHDTAKVLRTKKQAVSTTFDSNAGKTTEKIIDEQDGGAILAATDSDISSLLLFNVETSEATSGFLGTSDGIAQLREKGGLKELYDVAQDGNVVQMIRIDNPKKFTAILAFGKDLTEAFKQVNPVDEDLSFDVVLAKYEKGWSDYVKTLPKVEPKYQAQLNMAAMMLKAHEDKTHRGANIASLTVPWGGGNNANENNVGGYHLVWSRDLYQVATAYLALGDTPAANRALDFLFNVQQKADGSFPQNSWLDGKPFWNSLQMDEVAFPLILAYQLQRFDKTTYENHVKRAADFIVQNGPVTPQERWEERSGYSPSTIAAEIAGLICAGEIARLNGDEANALVYTATADDWARNIERWTATTSGKYGDGNYYLRLTQKGNPNAGDKLDLGNGAGFFNEREIIDAGFLELVRLGIKSPADPLIQKSLKVVDEVLRVKTPHGEAFYRYNHDGYGEMDDGRRWNFDGKYTGKGRLWALLSGERGEYELALKPQVPSSKFQVSSSKLEIRNPQSAIPNPKLRLDAMLGFANEGLMIPEQVWDKAVTPKNIDKQFVPELKFGEGTGSATPLAWSMAQFIRLAVNLKAGRNLDTPDIVFNRYVKNGIPGKVSDFGGTDEEFVLPPLKPDEVIKFPRKAPPRTRIAYQINGETRLAEADEKGQALFEFKMPPEDTFAFLGIETPDGATACERVKLLVKPKQQEFSVELVEKIKNAKTSPLFENGRAILFYRGDAKSVTVAGDLTNWNPGRIFMQKIADHLQAVKLDLGSAARVEYKFVADGKWILDEQNPHKLDNGVGDANSVLTMPRYKSTEWDTDEKLSIEPTDPNKVIDISVPPPIDEIEINSKFYGKKIVKVYNPNKYEPANETAFFPVMYFQDGSDYINRAKAIQIQRNLVKAGRIKPFIMVFLDPVDRMKEYWASDDYAKFVATEVVPLIDAKYKTIKTRDGRGIIGASLGGVTSVWVGLKYPEVFSFIGGQSSSFWIDNERVIKELSKLDANKTGYKFYFDDGILEGAEDTRRVNVLLRGKGYAVTYVEGETGHNWTSWRDRLSDAFVAFVN
jgi:glucan 1,4-alpha-glucosidase